MIVRDLRKTGSHSNIMSVVIMFVALLSQSYVPVGTE